MRKSFLAVLVLLAVGMTVFSSCGDDDPVNNGQEQGKDDDEDGKGNDDDDSAEYDDYFSKAMAKLQPGVYFYKSDAMEETPLFAKSTDGWVFYIPDVNDFAITTFGQFAVPYDFTAFEPTNRYHKIYEQITGSPIFATGYEQLFSNDIYEYPSRKDMLTYDGDILRISTMFQVTEYYNPQWNKIADSQGDNKTTYKYLEEHYFRNQEPMPYLDDMLMSLNSYKYSKWRYDTYPKTLEDYKIVFPVTAECTSIDQSVARDWDWPEAIDKVCRVSAIVRGISADDARKYIDKVKKEVAFTTQDEESVAGYTKFEGTREKVIIGDKEFEIGYKIIFTEEYMTVSFEITHIHYV